MKAKLLGCAMVATLAAMDAPDAEAAGQSQAAKTVPVTVENFIHAETDLPAHFSHEPAQRSGRGTYRGDKLSKRVFAEVVGGEYIAQELTPPSERWRSTATGKEIFKIDVRCYVYAGEIQLMAARLYQGQTTNFRTAGGGFAPIYVIGRDGEGNAKLEACA